MICSLVATLFLSSGLLASGQERTATADDMDRLQSDLKNLEADLASMDSLPDSMAQRVERIREEVIYLKVKMRKHQDEGGESTGLSKDEVRDLRLDIADLRNDLRKYLKHPAMSHEVTLESGTELAVRLEDSLRSDRAQPGDSFTAVAVEPILSGNVVSIEAGSTFFGRVEDVDRASSRTDRTARLVLAVERVETGGETHDISATVVRASERLETGLGSEAKKIGIGAGLGTVLGAVLGGKQGAAIGAAVGGGGSILATKGNEVDLPRGTILTLRLDRDLSLPVR
ncbi:MAG TPA: hypothetical protein VLK65_29675 [Vicinamibacteria bacterium]|nr:hypothetical protein [Vicinamibacteria bacterium]